jgi:maltooligosyltrehalose trehalohydrolase
MSDDLNSKLTLSTSAVGAQVEKTGVSYRVWAPDHQKLTVLISSQRPPDSIDQAPPQEQVGPDETIPKFEPTRSLVLERDENGYFSAFDPEGKAGDLYFFTSEKGERWPDPATRFQPYGVHGPSQCVDASSYAWRTSQWERPAWKGQVIYELHVGTFTEDGTFLSAIERLDHLVELGVQAIEIMPIADFAGERNWGYDGVCLYAPAHSYGRPDDLRALIDAAHQRGLAVILDVVYNHFGPDGNYLGAFAAGYFNPEHQTPWGSAFHYDGPGSKPVREFFVGNAAYWLDEYRFDGLRLDATHTIRDESEVHLLTEIADVVHARGGFVIAEDERNLAALLEETGHDLDAVWSDDFHHQVRVALTSLRESYFAAYSGTEDALAATLDQGWFYTGQAFPFWENKSRGTDARHLPPQAFVYCIENHDQVGNRALGERLEHLVTPEQFRAASALLCLSPYVPMIFMGQEWAASSPFQYFTNHHGELGRAISKGRRKEFGNLHLGLREEDIPDPQELTTFVRSKLNWREVLEGGHGQTFAFYREALRLRREWVQAFANSRDHWTVSVVDPAVVIRYQKDDEPAALLVVSFDTGEIRSPEKFPILGTTPGRRWRALLHTEMPRYGGSGRLTGMSVSSEDVGAPWLRFAVPGAVFFGEETF